MVASGRVGAPLLRRCRRVGSLVGVPAAVASFSMNKNLQIGLGVLLVLIGLIWTLQGLNVLGGSVMSGVTLWAVIGPIVAILGAWVVFRVARVRP
jgi:hypothetical protein